MEEINKTIENNIVYYRDTLSSNFVAWDLTPKGSLEKFRNKEKSYDNLALKAIKNGRN